MSRTKRPGGTATGGTQRGIEGEDGSAEEVHGVTHDQSGSESVQLGPAVYSELEFEGCRVKALIDTGSPATIVSLNCLLDSLAKGRMRDQTPAEWEAAVKRRLKPPEITLRSYGGGGLDLVGQLLATRVAHIARQLWI